MKIKVDQTFDGLGKLTKALKELGKRKVLVGVPAEKAQRKPEPGEPALGPNNAMLAYVHNYGSPAQNIPARPFMEPGIKAAKPQIVKRFKDAATAGVEGKLDTADKNLDAAGIEASASIKNEIGSNIPPPLAPATLAARRRRGRTGTLTLQDTGQMRNSITYVVKGRN